MWCCDYQFCTISSSKDWIHVQHRFKCCTRRVLGLHWWESRTVIPVGNKAWPPSSVNYSSKSFHSHHHHHHHHHHHLKLFWKILFSWSYHSFFYISKKKLNKNFPEGCRNVSYCYFQLNKKDPKKISVSPYLILNFWK